MRAAFKLLSWSIFDLHRGMFVCIAVALAAAFLAGQYRIPILLLALLLGMTSGFIAEYPLCRPGVDFASGTVLRLGVALLGLRILIGDVVSMGWWTVAALAATTCVTIGSGILLARVLGLDRKLGALSGGAVAICGASAAVALSAVMPRSKVMDRHVAVTIVTVTVFGSAAMISYPAIAQFFGLDALRAGVFLGASIHDVSHVVGAGYSVSESVGNTAVLAKMVRVVLLAPIVCVFYCVFKSEFRRDAGSPRVALPWFLFVFASLATISALGLVPNGVRQLAERISGDCLVIAIVAIGMKTSTSGLIAAGWRAVVLVLGESVLLGALALAWCIAT